MKKCINCYCFSNQSIKSFVNCNNLGAYNNLLILMFENEFLGKIYSSFKGSQNIFLTIFILSISEKLPLLKFRYFENYKRHLDSYLTFCVSDQLQIHLEQ